MELYIGGTAQGKWTYVSQGRTFQADEVFDGETDEDKMMEHAVIWNHYHRWFWRVLRQGDNPEELTRKWLRANPGVQIISDEVGNGMIPMDPGERQYRERLGRMLCELAQTADKVERILCGLGQRIK